MASPATSRAESMVPLFVSSVSETTDAVPNLADDIEVLEELVTPHPHHLESTGESTSSIRTILAEIKTRSSTRILVRVYSGPDCGLHTQLHASFTLSAESKANAPRKRLCWASFEHTQNKLLCILVNTTTVAIYDVYPDQNALQDTDNNWTFSLPFDCDAIEALPQIGGSQCSGLLFQRKPDPGDQQEEEAQFILKSPPKIWSQHVQQREEPVLQVPSLFTLHHPLEDVIPIILDSPMPGDSVFESRLVTDPLEKVLWVGKAHWDRGQSSQVLAVTYHASWKRHAVWAVKKAPPPPAAVPLYQQTAKLMMANSNRHALQEAFLYPHDLEPDEFSEMSSAHNNNQATRQEALADALGVKRTPRMSVEPPLGAHSTRSRQSRSATHNDLFSPRSEQMDNSHASWSTTPQPPLPTHISQNNTNAHDCQGPFGAIHSKVALECLYMEANNTSREAKQVFLVSNETASGTLTLCLLKPNIKDGGKSLLLQLDLQPTDTHAIKILRRDKGKATSLECISAQPVSVTPVPCGRASKRGEMATDLLVLTTDHRLHLYRASHSIGDVEIILSDANENVMPIELMHGLASRVTLRFEGGTGNQTFLRMRMELIPRSSLAEKVLLALDAAFAKDEALLSVCPFVALKIRLDVCRLEQSLKTTNNFPMAHSLDDLGWIACSAVLLFLVQQDLFGLNSRLLEIADKEPAPSPTAWNAVMQSDCQKIIEFGSVLASAARELEIIGSQSLSYLTNLQAGIEFTPIVFGSIHSVYEECKLSSATQQFLPAIASILQYFCSFCKPTDEEISVFIAYYNRHFKDKFRSKVFVRGRHVARAQLVSFARPPSFASWAFSLMKTGVREGCLDNAWYEGMNPSCFNMKAASRLLSTLFQSQNGGRELEVVTVLLEEGFSSPSCVREKLPPGIAVPCLELLYNCRNHPSLADGRDWSADAWTLVGRDDIAQNISLQDERNMFDILENNRKDDEDDRFNDRDADGLVPLERSSAILFVDNRVHEAARVLRSSRPIFLRILRTVETSDHDYERQKQKTLMLLGKRTLALPVGRGMLTLGSLQPVAAEPMSIPELCLKGRVPPSNSSLALDETECPSDMRVWPEFHNGVAAGLRLTDRDESYMAISRTWIIYNRPAVLPQEGDEATQQAQRKMHCHGGFILALGLRGHLTALEMSDVYDYLTKGQVTTTVGVLLGLAANKRGTCDIAVSKMLCLHIPSLIPNHFSAIDVASTVQAAAVIGTGLLFLSSSNRMITEFLLNEIGKRPETDTIAFDREAYTLACGISLGMVNLCIGDKGVDGRAQGLADLRLDDRLNTYIKGGFDQGERKRNRETSDRFSVPSSTINGDNERCSTVFESDHINVDLTAPAATLALGLMYMKSGNQTIATILDLPDTHFMLEFIRPDFLALRVVARTLILWHEVDPVHWITKQIPGVVSDAYAHMRDDAKRAMEGDASAGTRGKHGSRLDYDRRAVRQIYVHILAGACFGLGLRFAGTGDEGAKAAILERVTELHHLRESNDLVSAASRPDFSVLDTCLGCSALSLAMVMAGTGDLDALRLFKILRWRCEDVTTYGLHMIFGMATGLLFLGGGTSTLGREPEDIAMLVAAFFPRFPVGTSDNQYHLQACRHLYALAVKRRLLRAIDVDTNELVSVPIEIRSSEKTLLRTMVPCLLRNSDCAMQELVVISDKYYPLQICLRRHRSNYSFFVKKKTDDSEESLNRVSVVQSVSHGAAAKFVTSQFLRTFAEHFNAQDNSFISLALEDCNAKGTDEALCLYLSLLNDQSSQSFWDLKLIRAFYESTRTATSSSTLIVEQLLSYLLEKTSRSLIDSGNKRLILEYISIMHSDNDGN